MTPDLDGVSAKLVSLIPVDQVHRGWNVRDLTAFLSRESGWRWSVTLVGPISVHSQRLYYANGGTTSYHLSAETGDLGTVEDETPEGLVRQVAEWAEIMWGPVA